MMEGFSAKSFQAAIQSFDHFALFFHSVTVGGQGADRFVAVFQHCLKAVKVFQFRRAVNGVRQAHEKIEFRKRIHDFRTVFAVC